MGLTTTQIIKHFVDVNTISYNRDYSKLAKIHKYWSRKPWFVIEKYISKYSKEKDLILDPFCGSGLIGLETILQGRNFLGYDLNPFAVFLANSTLSPKFDEKIFDFEFEQIKQDLKTKIMALYSFGDYYICYTILGKKNSKQYNAILFDNNFLNKQKVSLKNKELNPKIIFPKGLKFPDNYFPKKFYKDRFSYKGVSRVSEMFTKRNLLALSILYKELTTLELKYKDYFYLAFTNTLLHASRLKSENVRPLSVNNYWIPDDFIEENVWWRFEDRVRNVKIAKNTYLTRLKNTKVKMIGNYKIYNDSSLKMQNVKNNSIDYLFTDPPYGDAIQYSELSYIWNTWLEKRFYTKEEIIINPVQHKGFNEFNIQMRSFVKEASRVLKNNGYFTLCFQNKDPKIWIDVSKIIYENKFKLVDISSYDTFGSPYNKNWARFSPKSDFYVTFNKIKNTTHQKVNKDISPEHITLQITRYLKKNNGVSFNLNKAYDLFVGVVINKIFEGYNVIDYKKLTISNIISMFEKIDSNGYK
jgi:DNA modification methylase